MPNNKIAVIGDKDSVLAFKALGVDVYNAVNGDEAKEKLKKCAREYSVILITEDLAVEAEDILKRYKTKAYPIVIPIPPATGGNGFGLNGVKADVEKAIGTDILFNQ